MEHADLEEVKRLILSKEQRSSEDLRKLTKTNEDIFNTLKSVEKLLKCRGRACGEGRNDSSEPGGEEQYLRDSDTVSKDD